MLVIYGSEKNLPPLDPKDKGHFHPESAEMWLVFAGQIRYAFEGQQPFVASEGDIVYVPAGTWHATRFTGADPACRLSITEYVGKYTTNYPILAAGGVLALIPPALLALILNKRITGMLAGSS